MPRSDCKLPVVPASKKITSINRAPSINVNVDCARLDGTTAGNLPFKDSCDIEEERTKLAGAEYELADLHLDQASDQFLRLSKSCDPRTKAGAVNGFHAAHLKMGTWWWQMGRYFPPFRWYNIHFPRFWWVIAVALAIFFAILYFPKLRPIRYVGPRVAQPLAGISHFFLEKRFPRAVIMTPTKLTDPTEVLLFASMLQNSSEDVRRVLERAGGGLQLRSTTLLSLPSDLTNDLTQSLPNIKGVDLTGFAKFFFYVKRYFGTRVESQVGFCPPTKSADGTLLTSARIVASATVRSAWKIRGGPWPISHSVDDQYDLDAVAFAIAVRIMGSNRGRR
jgi:hypothetical protein